MTGVTIVKASGKIIGFKMEGHACYNPGGPDIICASLSAVSQMTVNGMNKLTDTQTIRVCRKDEGLLVAMIWRESGDVVTGLLDAFVEFVQDLSHDYPQYVAVEETERSDYLW